MYWLILFANHLSAKVTRSLLYALLSGSEALQVHKWHRPSLGSCTATITMLAQEGASCISNKANKQIIRIYGCNPILTVKLWVRLGEI